MHFTTLSLRPAGSCCVLESSLVSAVVCLHSETVESNGTYENTLSITPLLADNKEKRGLSLDGRLKDEDTNLASTTMYVRCLMTSVDV